MDSASNKIENAHLLKGILEVDENVTPFILNKSGVNLDVFKQTLESIVKSYPKVQGGEIMLSKNTNNTLLEAEKIAKDMKDEYVSLEHLILAVLKSKDPAAQLLKDSGITEKELKSSIELLRKGSTVTSQSAEETYNALNKYAKNLNELANAGQTGSGDRP